ncbi:MAG: acyl-CoA thioesterase [Synergistaceae bacterium]|nr:acyl-CoA thioesterase [Synergistaceae bacterium]
MGVAYYGRYMDWFEMGRSDLCRANGKSFSLWEEEGILLPVVEAHCRYKSSLYYDEEIDIETSITKLTKISVVFTCRIFHAGTSKLAAEGYTKHAFTSHDGKLLREGNPLERWLSNFLEESR